MGWEWEVEAWVDLGPGYRWYMLEQTSSKREMWRAVRSARKQGIGAIRTTWRPST